MPDYENEALFRQGEFDLPVAVSDRDGSVLTLREYLHGDTPIRSLSDDWEQWKEIALERIRREPDFRLASINAGIIDGDRAIREIEARSPVGMAIVEIIRNLIKDVLSEADRLQRRNRGN